MRAKPDAALTAGEHASGAGLGFARVSVSPWTAALVAAELMSPEKTPPG